MRPEGWTGPVVAGIDGSDESMAAARFAAEEAARRGVPLRLVLAGPWPEAEGPTVGRAATEAQRAAGSAVELHQVAVPGSPFEVLHRESAGAQLLVVGSRGSGGVAGLLLGSTATALAAHAECPVAILPDETAVSVSLRRSVVAGVAGREDDDGVLEVAVGEATTRATDLVAVHAWRDIVLEASLRDTAPLMDWGSLHEHERRLLAESLAGRRATDPDLLVREVVVRDRSARVLAAAGLTAELLVVGRRRPHLLGSTAHGVLLRARCPVLLVPLHESRQTKGTRR